MLGEVAWVDHRWVLVTPNPKPVLWPSRSKYRCLNLAKPRGRCQPFGANSKISYTVGNWQSLVDLHSLQRQRFRADLIIAFKIFTGLLDVDPSLLFSPSHSKWPKKGSRQGTPRKAIAEEKIPDSVVTAPSVNSFKKSLSPSPRNNATMGWIFISPILQPHTQDKYV